VHSTGSKKRLNRKTILEMAEFGDNLYSIEELVAELGAAYLNSLSGISASLIQNSAAYLNGWLAKLKGDKRFMVQASGQVQRAVDFILNTPESKSPNEVE
jgi:antirestriction protein ArdC